LLTNPLFSSGARLERLECRTMTAVCSRCRAALETNGLEGLCPRCLLAREIPLERIAGAETTPPTTFVPPTPAELAPLFPHLEVLELLGQGGMGAVYRARQVKLDRTVALKILPPAVAGAPGFAERFTREARTLARLNHPNIVAVHDFGDVNGLYYLVMEYVEGANLRQALTGGQLDPHRALPLVAELCSALQYAHEMGVVHRDIKPENVLLDRQGRVKVADFGLAKLLGPAPSAPRLTGTQQAMGTPYYMAPEQWERPLEVDHRADIYSLGVVFYELLTGELPLGKFDPPSHKVGVDTRLDEVVLRAIEKQPDQRYQQMSEMKSAVESVEQDAEEEEEYEEEPPPPSLAFEVLATTVMVALTAGLVAGLWSIEPYLVKEKYEPWGLIVFCVLFCAYDPSNRYLKRFLCVGFIGITLSVLACELTGMPSPFGSTGGCSLWVLLVGFPIAAYRLIDSFKLGGEAEEEEEESPAPILGLTPKEEELRLLLEEAVAEETFDDQLTALPDIDGDTLAAARKACRADPDDRVLGLLDFSGDGKAALLFGCRALYWRNGEDTPHPGTGSIPYAEMGARRFVNHGDAVYAGNDQFICPNEGESGIPSEQLTVFLYRVREVLTSSEATATGDPS
jgi:serine/threonine protein kinase